MLKPADKLVMMANQIAKNVAIQGEERAIQSMVDHVRKFWEPRMRETMSKHLAAGGKDLAPLAKKALLQALPQATAK